MLRALKKACEEREAGQVLSRREIARRCGVSKDYIGIIERSALKKLRLRLPFNVRAEFNLLIRQHYT